MEALRGFVFLAVLAVAAAAHAGGLAHSENFVVIAADQELAQAVLAKAEQLRKSLAEEWLGATLPPATGRVTIHAEITHDDDRGRTYVDASDTREYHVVWLNTSRERATGSPLRHELTHVVLASHFRGRLPAWADEGVASLQDDGDRREIRRRALVGFAQTRNWPNVIGIIEKASIDPNDHRAYTVAVSLTDFFLSRGDKSKFLQFAVAGKERGWNAALVEYYDVRNLAELQIAWQDWVTESARTPLRTAAR